MHDWLAAHDAAIGAIIFWTLIHLLLLAIQRDRRQK